MEVIINLQVSMGFVRAILYYIIVFTGMIILGTPYIIYKSITKRKYEITNVCSFYFTHVIFKLFGVKIQVEGTENIPKERGFIIVANHISFLDINVIWPAIGNTAFIAKAALWKAPIFGWVLNSIGCIPVHKNPRMNAGMGKLVRSASTTSTTSPCSPKATVAKTATWSSSRTAFSAWRKTISYRCCPSRLSVRETVSRRSSGP